MRLESTSLTFQEQAAPSALLETTHEFESTNILFAEKLFTVLVADIRDFTGLSQRVEGAKLSQNRRIVFS